MDKQLEKISIDDTVLVRQCQQGDSAAMGRLIVKYQDRVYNVIFKICSNSDDAAELTQDTFVKCIEKIDTFRGQSAFYTWLFRVAVNLSLNYCKRKVRLGMRSLDAAVGPGQDGVRGQLGAFLADDSAVDPLVAARDKEIGRIAMEALLRLDDPQRAVVVLRDIEGMSYAEISEALEIELGTVKSRLSRARENLRQILQGIVV
ncbi:MAG TPA: sigma-70 family RNA polymerase sigma factor [Phycisphaerales bacterium]|nr:sigma-70 family RNA polymerase sigma factor [Phycisphaerales bacterium]